MLRAVAQVPGDVRLEPRNQCPAGGDSDLPGRAGELRDRTRSGGRHPMSPRSRPRATASTRFAAPSLPEIV